jgi:hypothetical protein
MIAAISSWLAARGVAERLARPLAWAAIVAGVVAITAGSVAWIYRAGERVGTVQVRERAQQEHSARVAEARADERAATTTAVAIGAELGRADAKTDEALRHSIEDINDALSPPAAPGGDIAVAPVDRLRDTLNAGIDSARRSADAADAAR